MKSFTYHRPANLDEALSLFAEHGETARALAGGTDLVIELRKGAKRVRFVDHVIDLSRVDALRGIYEEDGVVTVGAMSTHMAISQSSLLRAKLPLLALASGTVGSVQTRNVGTIGGNIGNAAACADTIPPLICYDGQVVLQSLEGERVLPLSEFIEWPYHTQLKQGEIITALRIDTPRFVAPRGEFYKLGRRNAVNISRLALAAVLDFDGDTVIEARVGTGSATPRPHRMGGVEALLVGRPLSPEHIDEAAAKMAADMVAETGVRWSTTYKQPVLERITRRVLTRIAEAGGAS